MQKISIIVPCYNEEKFIGTLLENILRQDYPRDQLEVFVVDGMSTDRTREIIGSYTALYPFIRLLENKKRYVPFAVNLAINESTGEVIVRMDSHAEYPPNYVSTLVKALADLHADNTGGIWITTPANSSLKAKAIAVATSSSFGIGNAYYRIGSSENRKVDTVPFGCYPRSVFDRIGLFDEELLRNQDDEFNARLIRSGGSIWLIPSVKITYYARDSIHAILRMFYQYGFFKPLVNRKIGTPATARQLVPPLFVLFLALITPAFFVNLIAGYSLLALFGIYILIDLLVTTRNCIKEKSGRLAFYLPWLFFLIHISYGTGYIAGIFRFLLLGWKPRKVSSTR